MHRQALKHEIRQTPQFFFVMLLPHNHGMHHYAVQGDALCGIGVRHGDNGVQDQSLCEAYLDEQP